MTLKLLKRKPKLVVSVDDCLDVLRKRINESGKAPSVLANVFHSPNMELASRIVSDESGFVNRDIDPEHWEGLARLMERTKAGKPHGWKMDMPGDMKFTYDGGRANGQHRGCAVLASGLSIPVNYHFGLPLDAGQYIDLTLQRKAIDGFKMAGIKNHNVIAAATEMLIKLEAAMPRQKVGKVVSYAHVQVYEEKYTALQMSVYRRVRAQTPTRFFLSGSHVVACFWMAMQHDAGTVAQVHDFFTALTTQTWPQGANGKLVKRNVLKLISTANRLKSYKQRFNAMGGKIGQKLFVALLNQCWLNTARGENFRPPVFSTSDSKAQETLVYLKHFTHFPEEW